MKPLTLAVTTALVLAFSASPVVAQAPTTRPPVSGEPTARPPRDGSSASSPAASDSKPSAVDPAQADKTGANVGDGASYNRSTEKGQSTLPATPPKR